MTDGGAAGQIEPACSTSAAYCDGTVPVLSPRPTPPTDACPEGAAPAPSTVTMSIGRTTTRPAATPSEPAIQCARPRTQPLRSPAVSVLAAGQATQPRMRGNWPQADGGDRPFGMTTDVTSNPPL